MSERARDAMGLQLDVLKLASNAIPERSISEMIADLRTTKLTAAESAELREIVATFRELETKSNEHARQSEE